MDFSSIVYRSLQKHEEQQALDLWYSIFKTNSGFYERYFSSDASPLYREGDTLTAWHDNLLVSTVYIRRLRIRSNDNNHEYLCGVICNVATVTEYRRRGLSSHLLKMAIDRMEKNEFDLSMLGTEKHHHYATFGWEQIPEPNQIMIDWKVTHSLNVNSQWRSTSDALSSDVELLCKIYSDKSRSYQIDRSPSTLFSHWVKWEWENDAAIICFYEHGYAVIGNPNSENNVCVLEWRASNRHLEEILISLAVSEIRRRHGPTKTICLFALPQYMTMDQFVEWAGPVTMGTNQDAMISNIRLSNDDYNKIKAAFTDGRAVYWSGDYC